MRGVGGDVRGGREGRERLERWSRTSRCVEGEVEDKGVGV